MISAPVVYLTGIKPSELPVNTVINDVEHGKFIKETDAEWVEIDRPRYSEVPYIVSDSGFANLENLPKNWVSEKSDAYFQDFSVISVPMGWVPEHVDKEVIYWYDLGRQHVVRRTIIHEIIEDHPDLKEEDIATANSKSSIWREVPGHPKYETAIRWYDDKVLVRSKKDKHKRYRNRRENGFFVLYADGKPVYWCEGELGTADQIKSFYETGKLG